MNRKAILVLTLVICALNLNAQTFSWRRVLMDGSRTGMKVVTAENMESALGTIKGNKYYAPNGKVYKKGPVYDAARTVLAVQDEMKEVKQVVGHCPGGMVARGPESALSNWIADAYITAVEELSGKHVDVSFANFGGIRAPMPDGDVLADDIMSMFPFKNKFCYLELKGSDLRAIYERLASSMQVIGGARVVVRNGKLVSVSIGGEPLNDNKVYSVATIDFLLDGGDGLRIGRGALKLEIYDKYVFDIMMPYVMSLTAAGKDIVYQKDGRVTILK